MKWLAIAASGVLAAAGILLYLLSGADWAWWAGLAMVIPFAVVVVATAQGYRGGESPDGGVWGPP
jgi:hypothetical protein